MGEVVIPFKPRPWQHQAHQKARRYNVWVLHRRAGKTVLAVNRLIRKAVECPKTAVCAYIAPQYTQAKRVAWAMLQQFAKPIPGVTFNSSELCMTLPNGVRTYLLGAENPDPIRGLGLYHVACDEIAQWPERAWTQVIRPALSDHQGSADFIGTPMGYHNLFRSLYDTAAKGESWSRLDLNAEQTGIIPPKELAELRSELPPEDFAQEYMNDWSAAVRGAYFGQAMAQAEADGRITRVPHDPTLPVTTSWDLGMNDLTTVWFWQTLRTGEVRAIRCMAFQGTGLPDIVRTLDQLPYRYDRHIVPHDAKVRELGTGQSRVETARQLGMTWTVARNLSVIDGINAFRQLIPRVWFDTENCSEGIEALRLYRAEYQDERKVYRLTPLHDWTSHYADACRIFAVGSHGAKRDAGWQPIDYSNFNRAVI